MKSAIVLLEIDQCLNKIDSIQYLLNTTVVNIDNNHNITELMQETFDKMLTNNLIVKGKEKEFITSAMMLIIKIADITMPSILDNYKKLPHLKIDEEANEMETFKIVVKTLKTQIKEQLEIIINIKETLEKEYNKFAVKLSAIDEQLEKVDKKIKQLQSFVDDFCGVS